MKIITDPRCIEYSAPGHPERPARVSRTVESLQAQRQVKITWVEPQPATDESILRAHTPQLLERVQHSAYFDADTPAYPNIMEHARRSAGGALDAMRASRDGEVAFSLLRPPGHHATRNQAMGFCYLNSIAIATLEARALGCKQVVVFDFDVHHGNGTEDILLDEPGCAFISIHQYPAYPETGLENRRSTCLNYPLAPNTPRLEYRSTLAKAFDALQKFEPDLIAVSAGFDAYVKDPLADGTLEAEDYHWLGEVIRKSGIPAFSILEGGYSDDLPELITAYLTGLKG